MLDVQCNGKGMVLRVTLLAAGFVVGPNGASIHQIEAVAGVNIRTFNLPKDAVVRRATRKFHIDGAGPQVQAAVDIIHSAVQLYKFLAEGACEGKKVKRMHLLRGVLFRYEPPPRLRVPYAAQVEYSAEEVPLVRQQRSYKTTAAISQVRSRLAQRDEAMMRARLHDYRCGRAPQGPAWARDGGADHGGPPIEPVPVQYHGDAGPNLEALAGAGFNSEGYGFGFAGPYDGPEPEYDPAAYAPPPPALGGLPRSASGPLAPPGAAGAGPPPGPQLRRWASAKEFVPQHKQPAWAEPDALSLAACKNIWGADARGDLPGPGSPPAAGPPAPRPPAAAAADPTDELLEGLRLEGLLGGAGPATDDELEPGELRPEPANAVDAAPDGDTEANWITDLIANCGIDETEEEAAAAAPAPAALAPATEEPRPPQTKAAGDAAEAAADAATAKKAAELFPWMAPNHPFS